jgi:type II restriction enzyme
MNLTCDISVARGYTSKAQIARVVSEAWLTTNGFCLACDCDRLMPTARNTKARDFECYACGHPYELKSTFGRFGRRINDGAYASMMSRIRGSSTPSFLLMEYTANWTVSRLQAIHHLLITPDTIQPRKPLAAAAQRHGWVGCNILLHQIPAEGRIDLIADGSIISKDQIRSRFAQNETLAGLSVDGRRWTTAVLRLVSRLNKQTFTTADAYLMEGELALLFPANRNIRAKIRQQLQVLRDLGFLKFVGRGVYAKDSAQ